MAAQFEFPTSKRAMQKAWERMARTLTDHDQQLFMKELFGAMSELDATGKADAVWAVLNSWYRTSLFRESEGNQEALDWAAKRSKAG